VCSALGCGASAEITSDALVTNAVLLAALFLHHTRSTTWMDHRRNSGRDALSVRMGLLIIAVRY
jgi:hypothetical protein